MSRELRKEYKALFKKVSEALNVLEQKLTSITGPDFDPLKQIVPEYRSDVPDSEITSNILNTAFEDELVHQMAMLDIMIEKSREVRVHLVMLAAYQSKMDESEAQDIAESMNQSKTAVTELNKQLMHIWEKEAGGRVQDHIDPQDFARVKRNLVKGYENVEETAAKTHMDHSLEELRGSILENREAYAYSCLKHISVRLMSADQKMERYLYAAKAKDEGIRIQPEALENMKDEMRDFVQAALDFSRDQLMGLDEFIDATLLMSESRKFTYAAFDYQI